MYIGEKKEEENQEKKKEDKTSFRHFLVDSSYMHKDKSSVDRYQIGQMTRVQGLTY